MAEAFDDVVGLVNELVTKLVDSPDAVEVTGSQQQNGDVLVEVSVDEDDIGKVIGRQGRIIKALRTIARAAASQQGFRVEVELAE